MRLVLPLGLGLACLLVAQLRLPPPGGNPQVEAPKPEEKPAEKLALQNTGKPMVVEYHCTEEDLGWAGLACTENDPCRFFLEISSIEAIGTKIFLAGNIHSPTSTLYSILLASEDAGKTWTEPFERIRGAGLDHIQFVDFENGWISGQVLQPLPQDPFLLISSDGGKTWRRRPVFGESRNGSILQFWFSSRSNGSLIVDRSDSGDSGRYELFESPNGGETWMVRQVTDRLPKLRGVTASNPDWRIRADAATKAFRIERRAGERWTSLASFLVLIGTCTTPERPAVAPPPEPALPQTEEAPAPVPEVKAPPSLRRPRN